MLLKCGEELHRQGFAKCRRGREFVLHCPPGALGIPCRRGMHSPQGQSPEKCDASKKKRDKGDASPRDDPQQDAMLRPKKKLTRGTLLPGTIPSKMR